MIRHYFIIIAILLLSGCASDPVPLNYYLLHSPTHEGTEDEHTVKGRLRIDKLTLPDYLKQRGLAMQTGPATLFFSSQHVWAEPLSSDILQTLSTSLWHDEGMEVYTQNIYDRAQTTGVTLVVDDFIATHQGNIVLRGQYWLFPENGPPVSKRFNLQTPQQEDGFEHTVIQMRGLVVRLANEIAESALALSDSGAQQD